MYLTYDWFLDDNPDVQERVAKGIERGIERGKEEGQLQGLQKSALKIIAMRFPALIKQVQQPINQINNLDQLDQLIDQFLLATDEDEIRRLLKLPFIQ